MNNKGIRFLAAVVMLAMAFTAVAVIGAADESEAVPIVIESDITTNLDDANGYIISSGTINVAASVTLSSSLTVSNGATLVVASGNTLTVTGTITNNGSITVSGILKLQGTAEVTSADTSSSENYGSITISGAGSCLEIESGTVHYQRISISTGSSIPIKLGSVNAGTFAPVLNNNLISIGQKYAIDVVVSATTSTKTDAQIKNNTFSSSVDNTVGYCVSLGNGNHDWTAYTQYAHVLVDLTGNDFSAVSMSTTKADKQPIRFNSRGGTAGTSDPDSTNYVKLDSTGSKIGITQTSTIFTESISLDTLGVRSDGDAEGAVIINEGATVTVTNSLVNVGTTTVNGTLVNGGTLTNTGTITVNGEMIISISGSLTGAGTLSFADDAIFTKVFESVISDTYDEFAISNGFNVKAYTKDSLDLHYYKHLSDAVKGATNHASASDAMNHMLMVTLIATDTDDAGVISQKPTNPSGKAMYLAVDINLNGKQYTNNYNTVGGTSEDKVIYVKNNEIWNIYNGSIVSNGASAYQSATKPFSYVLIQSYGKLELGGANGALSIDMSEVTVPNTKLAIAVLAKAGVTTINGNVTLNVGGHKAVQASYGAGNASEMGNAYYTTNSGVSNVASTQAVKIVMDGTVVATGEGGAVDAAYDTQSSAAGKNTIMIGSEIEVGINAVAPSFNSNVAMTYNGDVAPVKNESGVLTKLTYDAWYVTIGTHTNGIIEKAKDAEAADFAILKSDNAKIDVTENVVTFYTGASKTEGVIMTLTAVANANYDFTAWTGVVTAGSITSDLTVGATFSEQVWTITIGDHVNGAIKDGEQAAANFTIGKTQNAKVDVTDNVVTFYTGASKTEGVIKTLTAVADEYYGFTAWTGVVTAGSITADLTVGATFVPYSYAITLLSTPAGYGSISPTTIADQAHGTAYSVSGAVLRIGATAITATPAEATAQYSYAFDGWYIGDVKITEDGTITSAVTFTAKFTRTVNSYTVSFNSNGGSVVDSKVVEYGSKVAKPTNPVKEGFIFAGWFKEAGLENEWNFDVDTVTANTALYARWDEVPAQIFVVTFDSNGGSAVASQEVEEGKNVDRPADPTKDNSRFNGWYTTSGLTTKYVFTTPVESNMTLYAGWIETCTLSIPAATAASHYTITPAQSMTGITADNLQTVTVVVDDGYEGKLYINGAEQPGLTYVMTGVTENIAVSVKITEASGKTTETTQGVSENDDGSVTDMNTVIETEGAAKTITEEANTTKGAVQQEQATTVAQVTGSGAAVTIETDSNEAKVTESMAQAIIDTVEAGSTVAIDVSTPAVSVPANLFSNELGAKVDSVTVAVNQDAAAHSATITIPKGAIETGTESISLSVTASPRQADAAALNGSSAIAAFNLEISNAASGTEFARPVTVAYDVELPSGAYNVRFYCIDDGTYADRTVYANGTATGTLGHFSAWTIVYDLPADADNFDDDELPPTWHYVPQQQSSSSHTTMIVAACAAAVAAIAVALVMLNVVRRK